MERDHPVDDSGSPPINVYFKTLPTASNISCTASTVVVVRDISRIHKSHLINKKHVQIISQDLVIVFLFVFFCYANL